VYLSLNPFAIWRKVEGKRKIDTAPVNIEKGNGKKKRQKLLHLTSLKLKQHLKTAGRGGGISF